MGLISAIAKAQGISSFTVVFRKYSEASIFVQSHKRFGWAFF
jgi:hypothetical protein